MSKQANQWAQRRARAKQAVRSKKKVSDVSEQANRRVSGPLLTSGFLVILNHSASGKTVKMKTFQLCLPIKSHALLRLRRIICSYGLGSLWRWGFPNTLSWSDQSAVFNIDRRQNFIKIEDLFWNFYREQFGFGAKDSHCFYYVGSEKEIQKIKNALIFFNLPWKNWH